MENEQKFLDAIQFLDVDTGMEYCMQKTSLYKEMIHEYLEQDHKELLDRNLEENMMDDYRINVHALKSNSLMIGATHMWENAKTSEDACKQENYDEVRNRHQALVDEYTQLCEQLRESMMKC